MEYLEHFAKNLKYYRQEKKLTQSQLAELLNVHVSTIARIETAEHQASYKNIDKIVKILNVSYEQFFNYYEPDELNDTKKELIEKINFLTKKKDSEDLQHFWVNMESYVSAQIAKKTNK